MSIFDRIQPALAARAFLLFGISLVSLSASAAEIVSTTGEVAATAVHKILIFID
jgi:Mn2+/Fe2+ NRAMP family transporter